ncbi:hypothetical protein FISHEDRAFT_61282 [Fistulina hepatica ATCC 64428]|uniref:Uncharacterized protein n=1 Tax=Fistulina hepatica ATCC 64428 TaxID=1128425 RepID=A0A0D7A2M1_9AGAR|nr:hypothetical protein FISHEDRAFT_61282 [Fistulina hepatica ATCC 64428]
MSVDCLPPTSNRLTPEERLRLIGSSRKLASFFGVSPHFVDPEDHVWHCPESAVSSHSSTPHRGVRPTRSSDLHGQKSHRREASVFGVVSTFSETALPETIDQDVPRRTRKAPLHTKKSSAPQLHICVETVPVRGNDPRLNVSFPHSRRRPSICSPVSPPAPLSPTSAFINSTSLPRKRPRRKTLEKVCRVFGEQVPTELVFPLPPPPPPPPQSSQFVSAVSQPRSAPPPSLPQSLSALPRPPPISAPLPLGRTRTKSSSAKAKGTAVMVAKGHRRRSMSVNQVVAPLSSVVDISRDVVSLHSVSSSETLRPSTPPSQSKSDAASESDVESLLQLRAGTPSKQQSRTPSHLFEARDIAVHVPLPTTTPPRFWEALRRVDAREESHNRGKRSEQTWSGEWNQDVTVVAQGLRGLRIR